MRIQMLTTSLGQTKVAQRSKALQRPLTVLLLTVLWLAPLLMAGTWSSTRTAHPNSVAASGAAGITSDTSPWAEWAHAAATTAPHFTFPQAATTLAIDPAFAGYYAAHAGATLLGPALTPALPTSLGLVQFFAAGALLQPGGQAQIPLQQAQGQAHGSSTSQQSLPQIFGPTTQQVLRDGLYNSDSGIVRLALFHALLSAGSTLPIGGDAGSLSYIDLRRALQPSHLVIGPQDSSLDTQSHIDVAPSVFVAEGKKGTASVGHVVPNIFWQYMTRNDIAPDGWAFDFGQPLTEALSLTATRDGQTHHLVVQAFLNSVLVADTDAPDPATGQPSVQVLDVGRAYLQTFGPPTLNIHPGAPAWGIGDTAVLDTPTGTTAKIHTGQAFPFTLAGDTQWVNGALWYHTHWQMPHSSGDGWVSANALSFASPGNAPAWASFEVLSPDLASYLAAQGQNTAAVVYDVTRNQYYTYNADGQFTVASSVKVPLMMALLTKIEDQGRDPNDAEMNLLTTMIENSNNNSAQAIWEEDGGAPGVDAFMRRVGVPGLAPDPDAWGWSTVSPLAMVRLLTLLHEGKVLNARHRALALNLMQNVESDQQIGVGDTAPHGATVALKDGWVPAPDGLWAMNSSGIVTVGGETYIVAVYTQHEVSLDDGWSITRHVCATVAAALT